MSIMSFGTIPNVSTFAHTVVTVGATTTNVIASNEARVYLLLVNDSDEVIYIKCGASAVLNEGIRLNAIGGKFEISPARGNLYTGSIKAVCTSGSKKMLVTEG